MTEEEFLELFKYTGSEVIPGEFYRAVDRVVERIHQSAFTRGKQIGYDKGWDECNDAWINDYDI